MFTPQNLAYNLPWCVKLFLISGSAPCRDFFFSCCVGVLNAAMAPFISGTFNLSSAQMGLL